MCVCVCVLRSGYKEIVDCKARFGAPAIVIISDGEVDVIKRTRNSWKHNPPPHPGRVAKVCKRMVCTTIARCGGNHVAVTAHSGLWCAHAAGQQ